MPCPKFAAAAAVGLKVEAHVGARSLSHFVLMVFYSFLFLHLLVFASEDSRYHMGGSTVMTPDVVCHFQGHNRLFDASF